MRSFWISQVSSPPSWNKLSGTVPRVDVAIVGGGITGISAGIKLKEEGKKVAVIEARKIGGGVTGNSTAKVTSLHRIVYADILKHFGEQGARDYANMNQNGIKAIAENVKKYSLDCDFEWKDAVTFTRRGENIETLRKEADVASKIGLDITFEVYPNLKTILPFPAEAAIRLTNQAQFNPTKYCLGLAKKIEGDGCYIYEDSRVIGVSDKSPHKIQTESGEIEAEYVILATHLPILDQSGHFSFCKPMKSYCAAYSMSKDALDKIPNAMCISLESDPTVSFRTAPSSKEGEIVLVFSGSGHPQGKPILPTHEAHYQQLENFAKTYFPVQNFITRWSALDYMPPDELPYIGKLNRLTRTIFTATGFKKWGFSTAAAAAQIFADIIEKRENNWLRLVDSTRWDLKHSIMEVGKLNLEIGKDFVVDRVKHVKDSKSLEIGSGRIVKHGNTTCAMYRTEEDKIYALSPSCTHLGCHVRFNDADKTWDCPCHGSIFSIEGEILHGPATKPLKRYNLQW